MVLPTLAVAPLTLVGNGEIVPIVQLKLLGVLAPRGRLKAPQVLAVALTVITGVGFTVTNMEPASPTQPNEEVGVTRYWITAAALFTGLPRVWIISDPEEPDAPLTLPGFVPIAHVKSLGVLAWRMMSIPALLHVLLPVVVTDGVGFTMIAGLVTTKALLHPTPR